MKQQISHVIIKIGLQDKSIIGMDINPAQKMSVQTVVRVS